MDKGLKEIINKSTYLSETVRSDGESLGDKLKDRVLGDKAKFMFTCPSCKKEYTTKERYNVEGNYVAEMGRIKAESAIRRFIRKTVGIDKLKYIPVIGVTLYDHFGDLYHKKEQQASDAIEDKFGFKYKKEAFSEFEGVFMKSNSSDKYCCKECV
ncbi:MAG: hypothetical protein OEX22_07990 [Cyclobacteriaceae bacterium]|nr:hypothetical protein [Cyclobacteriaceae bacterium]